MSKKKFKDTKFAKFCKGHAFEIGVYSASFAIGAGAGLYIRHLCRKCFNTGFWNGYEFGGADVIRSVSETENGTDVLLATKWSETDDMIDSNTIKNAVKFDTAFKNYLKEYRLEDTMPYDTRKYIPLAKKRS